MLNIYRINTTNTTKTTKIFVFTIILSILLVFTKRTYANNLLMQKFKISLIKNEGLSMKSYQDPLGYWTICSGQRFIFSTIEGKITIVSKVGSDTPELTEDDCRRQGELAFYYYNQQAIKLIGKENYKLLTPQEKLFLIDCVFHNGLTGCKIIKEDLVNWVHHRTHESWERFQHAVLYKLKNNKKVRAGFNRRRKKMLSNITRSKYKEVKKEVKKELYYDEELVILELVHLFRKIYSEMQSKLNEIIVEIIVDFYSLMFNLSYVF